MTKSMEVTAATRSMETITTSMLSYSVTTKYMEGQEMIAFMVVMVMTSYTEGMMLIPSMAKQEKTLFMVMEKMIQSMQAMDGTQSLVEMAVILSALMMEEMLFGSVTVMVIAYRH